jgi:cellulose synthase/poly-beta-1,6-N-acetylglucosamine synthase-like glycosyltransferase
MSDEASISVVIPVYNEAETIGEMIRRVLECGFDSEVIVVDDASTDGTRFWIRANWDWPQHETTTTWSRTVPQRDCVLAG